MFQRRGRRFRRRPNDRAGFLHGDGNEKVRLRSNSFSNGQTRNKFRPPLSAEKLLEKYNTLAKEAMSSGDETLSENYLQHADHFMRIIEDKNRNQNQRKPDLIHKPAENNKNLSQKAENNKNLSQKNDINLDRVPDNKE